MNGIYDPRHPVITPPDFVFRRNAASEARQQLQESGSPTYNRMIRESQKKHPTLQSVSEGQQLREFIDSLFLQAQRTFNHATASAFSSENKPLIEEVTHRRLSLKEAKATVQENYDATVKVAPRRPSAQPTAWVSPPWIPTADLHESAYF
jgi:hypothetical protein